MRNKMPAARMNAHMEAMKNMSGGKSRRKMKQKPLIRHPQVSGRGGGFYGR